MRLLTLLAVLLTMAPASALESKWEAAPEARARLVAGVSTTGTDGPAPFGIEIVLKEGWKTYWKAPGPQGYPPRLIWDGSENVAGAELTWPAPERFTILGYDSIGYAGGVLLPLAVTFKDPAAPAKLNLTVDYLTCADVCIPQFAKLTLVLPAGKPTPTNHAFAIDRARGQAPAPPGNGDEILRAWMSGPDDQPVLNLETRARSGVADADVFVDGLGGYFFAKPKIAEAGEGRVILSSAAIEAPPEPAALGAEAAVTLLLDGRAIEQKASLIAPPADMPAMTTRQSSGPSLLLMLGFALLGGLILNVMPCVLPVLAIKLMGALKHAEGGRRQVRLGFAASAAGIIVSFGVLAAGAIALKQAGMAVGWGMQFQQPLFVAFMALVMAGFAANLWGLFEFQTLNVVNRASEAAPAEHDGLGGSFWSGVLATALATPCSAPFVGSALSFALTRGTGEILAIFLAMGVGLALPYLATAAFPALARLLPRPGAWMGVLRKILAVAVALTGVWLLWVLSRQAGMTAAVATLIAAIGLAAGLAVFAASRKWLAAGAATVAGLVVVWLTAAAPMADATVAWAKFDQAELDRRVAAGETVLVDVTADWCVTCKWNKATVLSRDPVASVLDGEVLAMQADWTRPDPVIGDYLASFGRFGIPFNAVYGPAAPEGLPLPELLSDDVVLEAVKKAKGG